MKERKKKQHDSRLLRAEKVILAVETERGHYALDAPEMSRPADESSPLSLLLFLSSMFFSNSSVFSRLLL
jgi:hypothetical protein